MKTLLVVLLLALDSYGTAAPFRQTHATFGGMTCYFGVLHAHCVLSPDFLPRPSNFAQYAALVNSTNPARFAIPDGPVAAWERAAGPAKLDFLALSDHLHGKEGQAEPCPHEMPIGGYKLLLDSARKINTDPQFQGKFLAIPAMEWSTIGSGNHVNIFFAGKAVPNSVKNGDFRRLLDAYLNHSNFERDNPLLLVQLNHPNQNGGSIGTNYGRNLFPVGFGGDREFTDSFGKVYVGIEHINNSSNLGNGNTLERNEHQEGDDLEGLYKSYLNMGLRLAPVGDHDNHRANWGRHTAARTGVWARSLSAADFVEAYRARRVFATEDNEMSVRFMSGDQWMGATVPVAQQGAVRTFTVQVDQMADTDAGQVQNEGPYMVELFGDDTAGGPVAQKLPFQVNGQTRTSILVNQGQSVQIRRRVTPGNYLYLHVRETNGQDSGEKNADAWTAPIFFVTQ
jgi:hypothetical protein